MTSKTATIAVAPPSRVSRHRSLTINTRDNGWTLSVYDDMDTYELVFVSRAKLNKAIQTFLNEERPELGGEEE